MSKIGEIAGDFLEDFGQGAGDFYQGIGSFVKGTGDGLNAENERSKTNNLIALQDAEERRKANDKKWKLINMVVTSFVVASISISLIFAVKKLRQN